MSHNLRPFLMPRNIFSYPSHPSLHLIRNLPLTTTARPRQNHFSTSLTRPNPPPVSGIWYVPNPSGTEPASVVARVPVLNPVQRDGLRHALFVVSSGLVGWVEKGDFVREALERMYSAGSPGVGGRVVSYVAVVDGLPGPEWFVDRGIEEVEGRPVAPVEGIAVCSLWDVLCREKVGGDVERPALLRVCSAIGDGKNKGMFATLSFPLANTLFVNGRFNTAFKVEWDVTEGEESLTPKHDPVPVDLIQFSTGKPVTNFYSGSLPLHPLTQPRKVISSMGNVIREVEDDKGQPLRASAELEAVVPKFLAKHNANGQVHVQVFAKIMPPSTDNFPQTPADVSSMEVTNVDVQDILWSKGRICRVMSGGGGWGKKAGLLSLQPATNFDPPPTFESSMFPDLDALDTDPNDAPGLEVMIPSGHTIQFFAAKIHPQSGSQLGKHHSSEDSSGVSKMVFGNTVAEEFPSTNTDTTDSKSISINAWPGHFGALSQGGASIAIRKDTEPQHNLEHSQIVSEFRVDVPHTRFKI